MAPVTKNRSIRLNNDLWAWLEDEAPRRGLTVNGMVSGLVEAERGKAADVAAVKRPPARAVAAANREVKKAPPKISVSLPLAGTFERKAKPKGQK